MPFKILMNDAFSCTPHAQIIINIVSTSVSTVVQRTKDSFLVVLEKHFAHIVW